MISIKPKALPKYLATRRVSGAGCWLCDNIPNQDGYIRVARYREGARAGLQMLHIKTWEDLFGTKPEGKELNHLCGQRSCCNPDHLELIDGSAHATLTNVNRVGYKNTHQSDEVIAEIYSRVKYGGEFINIMCVEYSMKRSTLSSIMNKRSRSAVTDKVDQINKIGVTSDN